MSTLKIYTQSESLIKAAAEEFCSLAEEAIRQRGRFAVALSGGTTPQPLYQALGSSPYESQVNWRKVHFFWGDERHVPPDHPQSNFKMAMEAMFDTISIPKRNIHRVPAELDVHQAAQNYEEDLRAYFEGDWPRFDMILLGMGSDGHTASLFPHSEGLLEEDRWFIANLDPRSQNWRLTLTKNAINAGRRIIVLVRGRAKAEVLRDVIIGGFQREEKPIQLILPVAGSMHWMVDRAAARKFPKEIIQMLS